MSGNLQQCFKMCILAGYLQYTDHKAPIIPLDHIIESTCKLHKNHGILTNKNLGAIKELKYSVKGIYLKLYFEYPKRKPEVAYVTFYKILQLQE